MAQPYVGEIRMFAGSFAPQGWEFCNGQQLSISENETLFMLIGTAYGGDGENWFGLPDLRGRIPVHQAPSTGFPVGQAAGVEQVTLTTAQIPAHTHAVVASTAVGTSTSPVGNVVAAGGSSNAYRPGPSAVALSPQAMGGAGGSQPHTNLQPYLCIQFIISLYGIFPSPT